MSLFVFRNRKGTKNYGRFAGKEMTFPAKFLQFSTRGKLCCNVNEHRGGQINFHITVLVSSRIFQLFSGLSPKLPMHVSKILRIWFYIWTQNVYKHTCSCFPTRYAVLPSIFHGETCTLAVWVLSFCVCCWVSFICDFHVGITNNELGFLLLWFVFQFVHGG